MTTSLYSVDAPLPEAYELIGKDFQLIFDGTVYLTNTWQMSYFSPKILSLLTQDPCLRSYTVSFSAKKDDILSLIQYIESFSVKLTQLNVQFMWLAACEFESMDLIKLVGDFLFPLITQQNYTNFFIQSTPAWTIPHIIKFFTTNPGLIPFLIENRYSVEIIEAVLRSCVIYCSPQYIFDLVTKVVAREGPSCAYLYSIINFNQLPARSIAYITSIPGCEVTGPLWRSLVERVEAQKARNYGAPHILPADQQQQQQMPVYDISPIIQQAQQQNTPIINQQPSVIQQVPQQQSTPIISQQPRIVQQAPQVQQVPQQPVIQQPQPIQAPKMEAKPLLPKVNVPKPASAIVPAPAPAPAIEEDEYEEEEEEEEEDNEEEENTDNEEEQEDMGDFEVEPKDVFFSGEPLQGIFYYIAECVGSPVVNGFCAMQGGGGRQKALKYLIDMNDHERWWCNKLGKESHWEDAWITISFLKHTVKLTNYTFHCFIGQPFCAQPKSWCVYGANRQRGEDWNLLDKQDNVKGMNCKNPMMTFPIPRKNQGIYTDYKIVCTENFTKHEDGKFFLTKIEFFGSLLYQE